MEECKSAFRDESLTQTGKEYMTKKTDKAYETNTIAHYILKNLSY